MAGKIFEVFINSFLVVGGLFALWLVVSWLDVLAHQCTGGTDAAWNAFVILLRWKGLL